MSVKLLTDHQLDILSLKEGCTESFEYTLVKMSDCWKSHVAAHSYNSKYRWHVYGIYHLSYIYQRFAVPTPVDLKTSVGIIIKYERETTVHFARSITHKPRRDKT